ncbi:hypothetical protein DFH08DRAFT_513412 [Mycena albidolilacea]|uniref:Uncharacterized protein n=1 Tax=Mycena albidolilacea TaxID=1033008 RepID=A0AAD7EAF1_9AGAR|nr:hypothetical protein DFH08DRAFT_513412 [Mycena albidolilacea]
MPDFATLPANFASLILASCFYGILIVLFVSTIYFLATRRTLAGKTQTSRHHFTSLPFLGVTGLFLVITAHWSVVIYQGSFAFIHLGNVVAEENFYSDFSDKAELVKAALLCASVLLGDSLVIYRLWIIWGRNRYIITFPIFSLACTFVAGFGTLYEFTQKGPRLRGTTNVLTQIAPWIVTGGVLSLIINLYSTGLIIFRICKVTTAIRPTSDSRLMYFLNVLVESAALQTFWLVFGVITEFAKSDAAYAVYAVSDTFPAIIGIANLLIHARVGLGWSHDQTSPSKATGEKAVV